MIRTLFLLLILALGGHEALGQTLTPMVDSVAMRDGKKLAVDIHLPNQQDSFHVILIHTPYNRLLYRLGLPLGIGTDLANSDYAVVIADRRCFYGSVGACILQPQLGEDGYDLIDWIVQQPWAKSKVGTWGPSALGIVQFQTAREQHPAHACAVPLVAGSQTTYDTYFPGGVALEERIEQLDALGFGVGTIFYNNPHYNALWSATESATFYPGDIETPTLMIGGWYDHNTHRILPLFDALQTSSPAAAEHRLLMGPWVHGGNGPAWVGSAQQGELSYPNAAGWHDSMALAFFDLHLRSLTPQPFLDSAVTWYMMGEDAFHRSSTWAPEQQEQRLYCLPGGQLGLTTATQAGDMSWSYDPRDPSPTIGGLTLRADLNQGPYDQVADVESRQDNLIFTSEVLAQAAIVKGSIKARLFVSCDRLDTDVAVRITDVYPDGRSMLVTDMIQRLRFREGYRVTDTVMMDRDTVYEIEIEFPAVALAFQPGHRLRMIITGSNYPRFNRNKNSGQEMYMAGDTLIATTTLHMSSAYPSSLILPMQNAPVLSVENTTGPQTLMTAYPVPSSGSVTLQWTDSRLARLEVYDLHGRLYWTGTMQNGRLSLNTQQWVPGMYEVVASEARRVTSCRLVVQR